MAQNKGNLGLFSSGLVGKARRFKVFISFRFQATRWESLWAKTRVSAR
ncbi:hypothetical protein H6F61_00420 [Cyanobacteria bacterium FACHB-472]|nr:hypothetical protein [Cyanobacteria bacterium FACHB-472]